MNLIYVNIDNTSVMEAQVISLLEYYRSIKKFHSIILIQGYKNQAEKNILIKKLKTFRSKIIWFKTWPDYTIYYNFAFHSVTSVLDLLPLRDNTIIHIKGELYGSIIHHYLNKKKYKSKILIELRGLIIEEVDKYYLQNSLLKWNKILLFKRALRKINKKIPISVVSKAFKEYLITHYKFREENICIHPNIAGEQFIFDQDLRHKKRMELGFTENDLVAICSSGGGAAWQKDTEVILRLLEMGVKIINLSSKPFGMPEVINKYVSFKSMPEYLAAADFAILWRDNNIVNEVASPSKFSEFASMGLWLLHNGTVRIAMDFIRQNNSGIIVRSINEITPELLSSIKHYNRNDISTQAREVFGIEKISRSYISYYENIINSDMYSCN